MEVTMLDPEQPLINKRVEQYIALRDKIKKLDDEHKEKMKPFREALEQLNASLLGQLNAIGVENVKTDAGTVYKTKKRSATIADGKAFMDYIILHKDWDLLDRRANVTAVADHIDEFHSQPPGVNYAETFVVGVRRK